MLEDVSFETGREFVLVAGPNGAGKTTLFLAVLNLVPYRGEVCIDHVCTEERTRKIGYIPQRLKANGRGTVWEYVYLPARFRGVKSPEQAAAEALREVGLYELRDAPVASLSGGQLQRAAIARALAVGGEVLLLDEPTSSVSTADKFKVMKVIFDNLKREGVSAVFVEHDMEVVKSFAHRVVKMENGRVVGEETYVKGG